MNGDNSRSIRGAESGRFPKRLCEGYVQYLAASTEDAFDDLCIGQVSCTRVGWLQKENHLEDSLVDGSFTLSGCRGTLGLDLFKETSSRLLHEA